MRGESDQAQPSAEERILDAVTMVLARDGVAGVTMRGVARQAEVAVGLANYHFDNKTALICAALERIGTRDLELVANTGGDAREALRHSLRSAVDPSLLTADYLSLRLQLWSLAGVDRRYAEINQRAQRAYLAGLVDLLVAARPELDLAEAERRAADILVVQNGVWLTAILIPDQDAVVRALARCEAIAFD